MTMNRQLKFIWILIQRRNRSKELDNKSHIAYECLNTLTFLHSLIHLLKIKLWC